jgi:hypothetical protein
MARQRRRGRRVCQPGGSLFYYPTVKQPGTTTAKHKILTFSQKRQLHFRQLAKCDKKSAI